VGLGSRNYEAVPASGSVFRSLDPLAPGGFAAAPRRRRLRSQAADRLYRPTVDEYEYLCINHIHMYSYVFTMP
jgi:hypothetical protein